MRVCAFGLLAVIMLGTSAWSETLKEASITLDENNVKPFMERLTQVIDGGLGRVLSWYDNEWGFSNRMVDTAGAIAKLL